MKYTINELANSKGVSQPVREALLQMEAELEATNRQVEILSDALAESRREVAALKAVQEPIEFGMHGEKMMFKVGVQQFTLDYEPDTQDEFNFMRDMLIHAFSTFTPDVKTTPPAQPAVPEKCFMCGKRIVFCASDVCPKSAQPAPVQPVKDNSNYRLDPPEAEPAQRQSARSAWVGLAHEEIAEIVTPYWDKYCDFDFEQFTQDIEAKLKEKNT